MTLVSAALPSQISFQNVLDNRDVTTGEVDAILQDSRGFLWIGGASALFRFDAYELKQVDLPAEPGQGPKAIKFVKSLFEDSRHQVWIASRNGLFRYDPVTERVQAIPDDAHLTQKISGTSFLKIVELPNGSLVGCSLAGLFVIDPQTLQYSLIMPDDNKAGWLRGKSVNTALVSAKGDLWLGTDQGLELWDWQNQRFTLLKPLPEQPQLVAENFVTDVVADKNAPDILWLGTSKGLVRYSISTHTSTRYFNKPDDPNSLGGDDIWGLSIDLDGTLWIATDGGGLSAFDASLQKFINHKFEAGRATSISSSQVRTVYTDTNGDIWTGNFPNGLNFFDRTRAAIQTYTRDLTNPNSLSHNAITAVAEDAQGDLWLGTDGGGLNHLNRETGEFTAYKYDAHNPNSIGANAVTALYVDTTGLVWLGTFGASLNTLNPSDNLITRVPFEKRAPNEAVTTSKILNGAGVWSIKPDRENPEVLWITTRTGGISALNRGTQTFTNYYHLDNDSSSIANNSTWNTLEDSKGNFWVGTASGLDKFDKKTGKFEHYSGLSNPNAISLFEDSHQRLWVGTDAGLNLLDPATKTFTAFTKENGFIDDTIRRILEDRNGTLWISTLNGFASFNPENHHIKHYNRIAGRLTGGFSRSGTLSRQGEVLFGGVNGLRLIKPELLKDNLTAPAVVFTDLKIMSDSVTIGEEGAVLSRSINATDAITLDYDKTMFTLDFAALNFRDPAKNQYAYQLEGFDKDWIQAGPARSAKYTNLNPGTYVFKVKASNNDGVWNEVGTSLRITQLPPPWKTWWAYTIYGALGVFALLQFVQSQRRKRRQVEEQNRLLEQKVAARTAEVVEKSKDIEAMLINIQQGLFTINQDLTIHEQYSQFLETIFETPEIAGQTVTQLIFARARNLGSDALDAAQAALLAILGEDVMNFTFNESLLPKELEVAIGAGIKVLDLEWNPILDEDRVIKVMVSARDVTLVKKMEKSANEQKRQLEIVSQLLNISAENFLSFEAAAEAYIEANQQAIYKAGENAAASQDEQTIGLLFRNMHTIKGNSRTFGLSFLSNVVHDVESSYTEIKVAKKPFEPEVLLQELTKAKSALQEYGHVYRNVLRRSGGEERQAGFWMPNSFLHKILQYVEGGYVSDLKSFVGRLNAKTLEQCLQDCIAALLSIATQLDKKTPNVVIEAGNIRIKHNAQQLLRDIFSHILRNAVDHGLETAAERVALGKPEIGVININVQVCRKQLQITIRDDGRGLNLAALFIKGAKLGKWRQGEKPRAIEVAQLIFEAGVSTQDVVTDISGRGVGMDAVRQFVAERGGLVTIELDNENITELNYRPFSLVINLPGDTFFEE